MIENSSQLFFAFKINLHNLEVAFDLGDVI